MMSFPLLPLLFLPMKSSKIYTFTLEFHNKEMLQLVGFTTEMMHLIWDLGVEYKAL